MEHLGLFRKGITHYGGLNSFERLTNMFEQTSLVKPSNSMKFCQNHHVDHVGKGWNRCELFVRQEEIMFSDSLSEGLR